MKGKILTEHFDNLSNSLKDLQPERKNDDEIGFIDDLNVIKGNISKNSKRANYRSII